MRWTPERLREAQEMWDRVGSSNAAARELAAKWGERVTGANLRSALTNAQVDARPAAPPRPQEDAPAPTTPAREAEQRRGVAAPEPQDPDPILCAENAELLSEVTRLRKSALTEERVRRELLGLAETQRHVPDWLVRRNPAPKGLYGTPTLFSSDQHLGEVVDPEQCEGGNVYNMDVARARWRRMTERTVDLLQSYFVRPQYDGIVFALGGDGASGDIHEELSATNEIEMGPVVLELADLIVWSVRELKRAFGRVFVPAVIGNHPRMSHKPRAKGAAFTNFDWLAYHLAAREFRGDADVRFLIPNGPDAHFRIYSHRYVLTHGNQFRGGDGIIGPLGPVFRGDSKKRGRNAQVGLAYDTLLIGHFHQLRMDSRIIMNGSLKGYDEYASAGNFPFEEPKQACWITHPERGITFSMPVLVEDPPAKARPEKWAA